MPSLIKEGRLGADEAFLLSSRSALAPDLELALLGLRLGFFLESLPFRDFRPLPLAWSRLPLAKYFQSSRLAVCAAPKSWTFGVGWSPFIQSKILCQPKLLTIFGKSPTPGKNHFFYCSFFGGVKKSIKENSTFS